MLWLKCGDIAKNTSKPAKKQDHCVISPQRKKKENDVSAKNLHTSADSIHMLSLIEIVWLGFEIVSFSGGSG